MAIDTTLNQDKRGYENDGHVARGHHGRTISAIIADSSDTQSADFDAIGKLLALLIEVPALPGAAATLDVEIYPQDATNAEAAVFSESLTLAESTVHLVWIEDNVTGNHPRWLFGTHTLVVTANAALSGGTATIKVVPILGKH